MWVFKMIIIIGRLFNLTFFLEKKSNSSFRLIPLKHVHMFLDSLYTYRNVLEHMVTYIPFKVVSVGRSDIKKLCLKIDTLLQYYVNIERRQIGTVLVD